MPRATRDIDIVINASADSLDRLLTLLAEGDVYLDRNVAREELPRHGQFNVIDRSTTWKTDLIFSKPTPFGRSEFERRIQASFLGTAVFLATSEDTVLAKLEWAKLGQSEQQLRDVRSIVEVKAAELDRVYIEAWLDELGVRELWEEVGGV
jgi:hypothetical protein